MRYDDIVGRSLDRVFSLSDNVFAVALTLIVLDIHVPHLAHVGSDRELLAALAALAPAFSTYALSVLTLGIFWIGQQTLHSLIAESRRGLAWLHLLFLGFVTIVPFSTELVGEYHAQRVAVLAYWLNIFAMGATLVVSLRFARREGLTSPELAPDVVAAVDRRFVLAQCWYAAAAALCVFGAHLSLAVFLAIQLRYVLVPRSALLTRLMG